MRPDRRTLLMRRRLTHLPPRRPSPDGYLLEPHTDARAEDVRLAHNEAFGGDHPGFVPWTRAAWTQAVTGSRVFRPALSRVAVHERTGDVVAYVLVEEHDGHLLATGEREAHVSRVGTRRAHRGRGLAAVLVTDCLHAGAEAGLSTASLHVDADNPTGARRVYERLGFEVAVIWTRHVLDVQPPRP